MKVTVQFLMERGACPESVALFGDRWPDGVEITEASLIEAAGLGLDLEWLVDELTEAQPVFMIYVSSIEVIQERFAPLFAELRAWRDHERKKVLWAEQDLTRAIAWTNDGLDGGDRGDHLYHAELAERAYNETRERVEREEAAKFAALYKKLDEAIGNAAWLALALALALSAPVVAEVRGHAL